MNNPDDFTIRKCESLVFALRRVLHSNKSPSARGIISFEGDIINLCRYACEYASEFIYLFTAEFANKSWRQI